MRKVTKFNCIALVLIIILSACVLVSPPTPIDASHTAIPSPTPTTKPTQTPSPTLPPIVTPQVLDSPLNLPYDLIWVEQRALWRWDSHLNQVRMLAGESEDAQILRGVHVWNYEFVDSDTVLAAIRVSNAEQTIHDLYLLDLTQKTSRRLYAVVTQQSGPEMSISPDGNYLVYSTLVGKTLVESEPWDYYEYDYDVFLVELGSGKRTKLGTCSNRCESFGDWSNDSQSVAWRGEGGLWVTHLGGESRLVLVDIIVEGENTKTHFYHPFGWSTVGQFLLVIETHYEGAVYGVLDTQIGRFQPVTSYSGLGPNYELVFWLLDGRVIKFSYYPDETGKEFVGVSLFRIQSESNPMAVEEQPSQLQFPVMHYLEIEDLYQLSNQVIVIITTDGWVLIQYQIDLSSFNLTGKELVGGLGEFPWTNGCHWSPDKEWLLLEAVNRSNYTYLIASTDGKIVFDMSSMIGYKSWSYCWLERP